MYVCVCLAVTDNRVQEAIEDGAITIGAVTRTCGAGGDCGACHGMIETMIEDHLETVGCRNTETTHPQLVPGAALVRASRAA